MGKKYKYRVAISFADEDVQVAEEISKELNRLGIKNYFYKKEDITAKNIKRETWKVYSEESELVLMIVSKHYAQNKWSREELEVIQSVNRGEDVRYWISLRIDDTKIEGLIDNVNHWKWEGNASYIAISLFELTKTKALKKNKTLKTSKNKFKSKVIKVVNT